MKDISIVRLTPWSTCGLLLLLMGQAQAHFALVAPPSALRTEDGGKGGAPCGVGAASGVVTEVLGGHALPLQWQEFVFHPGHYRIALSVNSRSELPADPQVVESAGGSSISAAIQSTARVPVLADGMFAHTSPPKGDWRGQIVLPNLDCEKCTLQIIEFMAEHGAPFFYHHCADLKIKSDPSLPPADAAWPRSSVLPSRSTSAVMTHVADGGGWRTAITLVNMDTVAATFTVKFWGDNGAPLELSLTGLGSLSTVNGTLKAGASQTIQTDGSPPNPLTGWAELSSPQFVDGAVLFRFDSSGQEASVPLLSSGSRKTILPFESGPGLALGVAIANTSSTDDTTVSMVLRNELGDVISSPAPIALGRRQHTSFVLSVPGASPQRGVVELSSANADIVALGIRTNNGTFTSIRALNK